MAIAQVQKAESTTSGSTTAGVTLSSVTANNLLVMIACSNDGTYTLATGFTSAVLNYNATEDDTIEISYKVAAGGETTLDTTSWSGTNTHHIAAWEYSGVTTSSPLDKTASTTRTTGVSSLAAGNTGTLTQADEVAIAGWAARVDTTAESIDSSFTVENVGNGTFSLIGGTRIVSATTALNPTASWSGGTATAWGVIATFKAAAGGGSPITKFFANIIGAIKELFTFPDIQYVTKEIKPHV